MSMWEAELWTILMTALVMLGDNLMMRGELRGRWYLWAAGHVMYALAFSMLLTLSIVLYETHAGRF